jgi:hypothetical protein
MRMKTKYLIGNVNLAILLIEKVSTIPYLILVGNIDSPNLFLHPTTSIFQIVIILITLFLEKLSKTIF